MHDLASWRKDSDETEAIVSYLTGIRDSYSANARQFTDWISARGFSPETLRDYLKELPRQYRASTARTKRQAAFSRLNRLAERPELSTEDRARFRFFVDELRRDAPRPKVSASIGREKILTEAEYRAILRKLRGARDRGFIRFFYATGCRVTEAVNISLADCKCEGGLVSILLRRTKNGKERTVYIAPELFDELRKTFAGLKYLFETNTGKQYSRVQVSGRVKSVTARYLGRGLSVHKLRHSNATRLLEVGRSVDEVAQWLGHSSPVITLKYYSHVMIDPAAIVATMRA